MLSLEAELTRIFTEDIPLMDVRAPVEFARGAFPNASNHPILDDEQRRLVGTCYKEKGQDAAIELGWSLATPQIKHARQEVWTQFAHHHPNGYLYCFRGGLRSRLTQQLMAEAGVDYPLIPGGYKAMRRFLLERMDALWEHFSFVNIGGRTGSGKTQLLNRYPDSLDLEGLAAHRGSAFGAGAREQPSQIDFENDLAVRLMKLQKAGYERLWVEDEGRLIGRVALPHPLNAILKSAPLAVIEEDLQTRTNHLYGLYVEEDLPDFCARHGLEVGRQKFLDAIAHSLAKIRRRLGNERYQEMDKLLQAAAPSLLKDGHGEGLRPLVSGLLEHYYDPMYDYQLSRKANEIVFRGTQKEFDAWATP